MFNIYDADSLFHINKYMGGMVVGIGMGRGGTFGKCLFPHAELSFVTLPPVLIHTQRIRRASRNSNDKVKRNIKFVSDFKLTEFYACRWYLQREKWKGMLFWSSVGIHVFLYGK